MNETITTIIGRRSIRCFSDRPVEREKIEEIVRAGQYAPSGMNRQERIFIVVTDKEKRDELSRINASVMGRDTDPFYGAPAVIIVACKKGSFTGVYDASASIENMLIAAESLSLGSCWVFRAKEELESEWGKALLSSLGIEDEYVGVGNVALGYYDGRKKPAAAERRPGSVFFI